MKNRVKNLTLHRETLLGLQTGDLHNIAGGATAKTVCIALTCPLAACVVSRFTECGGPHCQ